MTVLVRFQTQPRYGPMAIIRRFLPPAEASSNAKQYNPIAPILNRLYITMLHLSNATSTATDKRRASLFGSSMVRLVYLPRLLRHLISLISRPQLGSSLVPPKPIKSLPSAFRWKAPETNLCQCRLLHPTRTSSPLSTNLAANILPAPPAPRPSTPSTSSACCVREPQSTSQKL